MLERWERVTHVKPHSFMRRGLFFAHRELGQILDAKEQNKPILLYTGRGPSSGALHLGHLIPFILTKYLQDSLDCYVIVQVTDDEKFMRDTHLSWETIEEYTNSNIADIIAQGFNLHKTFIMRESKFFNINVPFLTEISKFMTLHVVQNLFGFTARHKVGSVVFPAKQIAPAFAKYFSVMFGARAKDCAVLIPCGREQDPYFRYAREIAKGMKLKRVSTIYGRFIPALDGKKKMDASAPDSAIYLDDTLEEIQRKVESVKVKWKPEGVNLEEDVVFRYIEALDEEDEEVEEVRRRYGEGGVLSEGEERMNVEEAKGILWKVLCGIIGKHQENKKALTQEVIDEFEALKDWR
jgi:tryptophanyl-tRNA synthetase